MLRDTNGAVKFQQLISNTGELSADYTKKRIEEREMEIEKEGRIMQAKETNH